MSRQGRERAGRFAETLAAWLLRLRGYRILARRYATPVGEIDLVARRGELLVFVEVKRRAGRGDALALAAAAAAGTHRPRRRGLPAATAAAGRLRRALRSRRHRALAAAAPPRGHLARIAAHQRSPAWRSSFRVRVGRASSPNRAGGIHSPASHAPMRPRRMRTDQVDVGEQVAHVAGDGQSRPPPSRQTGTVSAGSQRGRHHGVAAARSCRRAGRPAAVAGTAPHRPARSSRKAVANRRQPRPSRAAAREALGLAAARGPAPGAPRAGEAGRPARRADQGAQLHHRLGEIPRPRRGRRGAPPSSRSRGRAAGSGASIASIRPSTRSTLASTGDRSRTAGDRGDRRRGVGADARQPASNVDFGQRQRPPWRATTACAQACSERARR